MPGINTRGLSNSPLANWALLRGHPQLCPGRASALATAAGAVDRLGVPLGASLAGRLARRQRLGIGGCKTAAGEPASGSHEAGCHFCCAGEFASFDIVPTRDALLTGQLVRLAAVTVDRAGEALRISRRLKFAGHGGEIVKVSPMLMVLISISLRDSVTTV